MLKILFKQNEERCRGQFGCKEKPYVQQPGCKDEFICLKHSEEQIKEFKIYLAEMEKQHEIGYKESLLYPNGE